LLTKTPNRLLYLLTATLTVCLILFSPTTWAYASYQPSPWALTSIEMGNRVGLITRDFSNQKFSSTITRRDFCELLINSCSIFDYPLPKSPHTHPFIDTQDKVVEQEYMLGLTNGTAKGVFSPDLPLTREMAVVMLGKLNILLEPQYELIDEQLAEQVLQKYANDSDKVSDWAKRYVADSYSRGIIAGTGNGLLDPKGSLTREQGVALTLNLLLNCDQSRFQENKDYNKRHQVARSDRATSDRLRTQFDSEAEALTYMETINVQVWQLENGVKKTATIALTVQQSVADDVKKIFEEIYNGKEKFPIKSCEGFAYRGGTSQHTLGLAIDINPNENYFIGKDSTFKAGKLWEPGENPYSIVPDGDVVRAFNKYGWHWSPDMNWSNGADYMHFSLSGT
jgi:hypothetical protein